MFNLEDVYRCVPHDSPRFSITQWDIAEMNYLSSGFHAESLRAVARRMDLQEMNKEWILVLDVWGWLVGILERHLEEKVKVVI